MYMVHVHVQHCISTCRWCTYVICTCIYTGAYEHRKAAQRSVKLEYILQTICCRITPVQTALHGKQ